MIGRVALLVTFKKAKPQSLSRSHIRDLAIIYQEKNGIPEYRLQFLASKLE